MKTFLLFLLFTPGFLLAQAITGNEGTLSIRPFYLENVEGILSGRKNSALGIALEGYWQKRGTRSWQAAGLELGFARPKSAFEPAAYSIFFQLRWQYEYLRGVQEENAFRLLVGGMALSNYRLGYYPNWDDSHAYWASFMGAGLSTRAEKPLGEQRLLYAAFQLPLAGAMSRPPASRTYKIEDSSLGNLMAIMHRQFQFASLNRYFNPRLALGLALRYSPRFGGGVYYSLEYVRAATSYSAGYRQITQGAGLTLIF